MRFQFEIDLINDIGVPHRTIDISLWWGHTCINVQIPLGLSIAALYECPICGEFCEKTESGYICQHDVKYPEVAPYWAKRR